MNNEAHGMSFPRRALLGATVLMAGAPSANAAGCENLCSRNLAPPNSISPEAQAALLRHAQRPPLPPLPSLNDVEGWRRYVSARDQQLFEGYFSNMVFPEGLQVSERVIGGVPAYDIAPPGVARDSRKVLLDIHGGGFTQLGGEGCRMTGIVAALRTGVRTISPDYRMPPDHPFPTPLDDCVSVYRSLLEAHRPEDIVVCGASAGGNLSMAAVLRARDEGLALPVAAVALTPEADLTESGDSFQTLHGLDVLLTGSGVSERIALYANGHDLRHPYLSPIFADFARGFPPTFVQSGTRDMFLSNAVLLHRAIRRGGVASELHIFEAMPHGSFGGAPEDSELAGEVRQFVRSWLGL